MATGVFFQLARGRAMVRTKSMREARYIKDCLRRGVIPHQYGDKIDEARFPQVEREAWTRRLGHAVERARRANRDWRKYRGYAVEFGEVKKVTT
jgi:G:T-mismatch repair DNA endonuclease (very short patch repair protein)